VAKVTDIDETRRQIRRNFALWDIDPSEFEIMWEESKEGGRRPGAIVRFLRNTKWQIITCYNFPTRAENLRQCFLLIERLRIAEQHGVQYEGLTSTKEIATTTQEAARKQDLLEAYDILGVSPDDPVELVKDVYRRKSMYYHPDKGGEAEKFKRLTNAYEMVMKSRGANP